MRNFVARSLAGVKFRQQRLHRQMRSRKAVRETSEYESYERSKYERNESERMRVATTLKSREHFGFEKVVVQKIGEYQHVENQTVIQLIDTTSKSLEARWNAFDAIDGLDQFSHCQFGM